MDKDIIIDINNIENYTIELSEQGPQGIAGPPGADGPQGPQGEDGQPGPTGVGIDDIQKTSTAGLVDTYTIYLTDGDSSNFTVTNGADATLNGYSTVTLTASDGLTLTQDGSSIDISGSSLETNISGIEALIPSEATSLNQLADKSFVTTLTGDLTSLTTTSKTSLVSAINELDSDKQDTLTFSTGLTNTSGTITVTDYSKLVKNLAATNDDFIVGGATGSGTSGWYEVAIGSGSSTSGQEAIGIGHGALAQANGAIVIGASSTTGQNTIILGKGTTSTSNIFALGFGSNGTYTMLDGTTGLIPDARISSNIARTSALASKQDTLVSGTNIKTINNESILGSGNIDIDEGVLPTVSSDTLIFTDATGISVVSGELIFQ